MDKATEVNEMPDGPERPDGLDVGDLDGPDQYELLGTRSAGDRDADSDADSDAGDRDADDRDEAGSADDTTADTKAAAVFVDPTGRRGRLVRPLGIAAGSLLAAYIVIVAFGLVTDTHVPLTPWPDPKPSHDSAVPGQSRLMLKQGRPTAPGTGVAVEPVAGTLPGSGAPSGSPSASPTGKRTPGASSKPATPTPKPSASVAPVPTPRATPKWPGWPWNTRSPKPKKG